MEIELDVSVGNFLTDSADRGPSHTGAIEALGNLASAYRAGHHIVIGPPEVFEVLRKCADLASGDRLVYDELLRRRSTSKLDVADHILLMAPGESEGIEKRPVGDGWVYVVPLSYFARRALSDQTRLLCEDLTDCYFYEALVRSYLRANRVDGVAIVFYPVHGGGVRTGAVYRAAIDAGHCVLAIIDSDRSFPKDRDGATLRAVTEAHTECGRGAISQLVALKVREKENLIPPSLYKRDPRATATQSLESLLAIESHPNLQDRLRYLDYKRGLKVSAIKTNPTVREYFMPLFTECGGPIATRNPVAQLGDEEFLIRPCVKNVAADFVWRALEPSAEEVFLSWPNYLRDDIQDLCRRLIAWGCTIAGREREFATTGGPKSR